MTILPGGVRVFEYDPFGCRHERSASEKRFRKNRDDQNRITSSHTFALCRSVHQCVFTHEPGRSRRCPLLTGLLGLVHLITLSALAARSAESTKNIVLLGFTFSSSVTFSTWYRSHVTLLVLGVNEQRETKVAFPPSSIFTENFPFKSLRRIRYAKTTPRKNMPSRAKVRFAGADIEIKGGRSL